MINTNAIYSDAIPSNGAGVNLSWMTSAPSGYTSTKKITNPNDFVFFITDRAIGSIWGGGMRLLDLPDFAGTDLTFLSVANQKLITSSATKTTF